MWYGLCGVVCVYVCVVCVGDVCVLGVFVWVFVYVGMSVCVGCVCFCVVCVWWVCVRVFVCGDGGVVCLYLWGVGLGWVCVWGVVCVVCVGVACACVRCV